MVTGTSEPSSRSTLQRFGGRDFPVGPPTAPDERDRGSSGLSSADDCRMESANLTFMGVVISLSTPCLTREAAPLLSSADVCTSVSRSEMMNIGDERADGNERSAELWNGAWSENTLTMRRFLSFHLRSTRSSRGQR